MMTRPASTRFDPSRRQALRTIAAVLSAVGGAACAPTRILLGAYPSEFKGHSARTQATLAAFVCTVEPGASPDPARTALTLQDPYYPLARYAAYLASDLDGRANRGYHCSFAALSCAERAAVVASGLAAGGVTGKLYSGAIYLAQIAVYAGLGFSDSTPLHLETVSRDNPARGMTSFTDAAPRFPRSLSPTGNPA